jgi:Rrf2 family protein
MFSVSAKTQYAIRAMAYLAHHDGQSVTVAEIAAAEGIPGKYLEGIMSLLKISGLVDSERGKHGGYRLAMPASGITMLSIVEALDGTVKPVTCVDEISACVQGQGCQPRKFWVGLKAAIDVYLRERTLKDVTEG